MNEQDEVIGVKPRSDVTSEDVYRCAALWVTNSKGNILLAKRHHTKERNPNQWGPAVAGTVEEGETYKENIIKETEEEIGVTGVEFTEGPKTRTLGRYNHFTQWFLAVMDKEIEFFVIAEDEVSELKWFTKEELLREIASDPDHFLKKMPDYVELLPGI